MATDEITRPDRHPRPKGAARDGGQHRFAPVPARRRVSLAYSRFVSLMKVGLPALALGLLALLAAWPTIQQTIHPPTSADIGRLDMNNARFFSIDAERQPFSVVADNASQSSDEPGIILLTSPEAEMTQGDGSWVVLKGRQGFFNQSSHLLRLTDDVVIMQDDGYEFRSDEAFVDTRAGIAWGNKNVVGQGPFGEIRAKGFKILDKGQTVVFSGAPDLSLATAGGPAQGAAAPAAPAPEPPAPVPAPAVTAPPTPSPVPAPAAVAPVPTPPILIKPPPRKPTIGKSAQGKKATANKAKGSR